MNNTITLNLKRKSLPPVLYERIDSNNVRIGTKWFQFYLKFPMQFGLVIWGPKDEAIFGTTIFTDSIWKK